MSDRESLVFKARMAEQAERFDEMVESMRAIATLDVELTVEERNLLSVAFKNIVGTRRAAWRSLMALEHKEEYKENGDKRKLLITYRNQIEKELKEICDDILTLIDSNLIPTSTTGECKVFFYKMKADYFRYLAEFQTEAERKQSAQDSLVAYNAASDIATAELPSTHPVRLGLALNYSVFYYEILNSPDRAIKLARRAFDEAMSDLDCISEETYKDATLIMQLIRDNLTLWSTDLEDEADDATAGEANATGGTAGSGEGGDGGIQDVDG